MEDLLVLGGGEWRRVAMGGDEWWCRWVTWGADAEGADVGKSLCVPSGEGGIHSCSLIFLPDSEQICSASSLSWKEFCVSCCVVCLADPSYFCLPSQLSRFCFFVTVMQFDLATKAGCSLSWCSRHSSALVSLT